MHFVQQSINEVSAASSAFSCQRKIEEDPKLLRNQLVIQFALIFPPLGKLPN
jgi:hypothetical protein